MNNYNLLLGFVLWSNTIILRIFSKNMSSEDYDINYVVNYVKFNYLFNYLINLFFNQLFFN